jgi:hypothetical protein
MLGQCIAVVLQHHHVAIANNPKSVAGCQGHFYQIGMPIVDRLCFAALRPVAAERRFWRSPPTAVAEGAMAGVANRAPPLRSTHAQLA